MCFSSPRPGRRSQASGLRNVFHGGVGRGGGRGSTHTTAPSKKTEGGRRARVCERLVVMASSVCQYVTACDCMSVREWEVCGVKMALMELDAVHNRQDMTSERGLREKKKKRKRRGRGKRGRHAAFN